MAPTWSLAEHGCVDLDLVISVKLPIPTFLIPLALCRWILRGLISLVYPYLLLLNETFARTPFAQRVMRDKDGFYKAVSRALNEDGRTPYYCVPCSPKTGSADDESAQRHARFVI